MQEQQQDKRSASQKIEDLERALMNLYQTMDNMARDMGTIKEAIKLLGNKLDAVVKASNAGETLSDEVIAKIMVQNNVDELKQKVTNLVTQGVLVSADEVGPNSFVVGRELSEDGTVQNPRMQFMVSALAEGVKEKFPGAKPGQTLVLQEGKWQFEILESYNIAEAPQVSQTEETAPSTETVESTESTESTQA